MKLNAVGVVSSSLTKTVEFYSLLGFEFPDGEPEGHIESPGSENSAKLMIDTVDIVEGIIGEKPKPGNHSGFAIEYDSPEEVDAVVRKIQKAGFTLVKDPWDAVWQQRYAIVQDPDGYRVDLYSTL